jgi:hypothetical protein
MIMGTSQRIPLETAHITSHGTAAAPSAHWVCSPEVNSAPDYTPTQEQAHQSEEISDISGAVAEGDHDRGSNAADIAANDPRS